MPRGVFKRRPETIRRWIASMKKNNGWSHSKASRKRQAETMKKAKRLGKKHWSWKGNVESGHREARRLYPNIKKCEICGSKNRLERHHKDGNTINNKRSNIQVLCIVCHNTVDGRMKTFVEKHRYDYRKLIRLPNGQFGHKVSAPRS